MFSMHLYEEEKCFTDQQSGTVLTILKIESKIRYLDLTQG